MSYFKYATPTPIRGEPSNKALKWLKSELRVNASSVESDLGSRNHSYLDLVTLTLTVQSEEVKTRESEVLNLTLQTSESMVNLYCPIKQLQTFATSAGIPYYTAQHVKIKLTVIQNTRDVEREIWKGNTKPMAGKTWKNYKTHFKEVHTTLKGIRGPTMLHAGYCHDKYLATQLMKNYVDIYYHKTRKCLLCCNPLQRKRQQVNIALHPHLN